MGHKHGKSYRIHACRWVCALGLGCLSLTLHAGPTIGNNFFNDDWVLVPTGNGGYVQLSNTAAGGRRMDINTPSGAGYMQGSYRIENAPGDKVRMVSTGLVPVGTTTVPVNGRIDVSKVKLAPLLRNLARAATPIGTILAFKDLLDETGLVPPTVENPTGPWKHKSQAEGEMNFRDYICTSPFSPNQSTGWVSSKAEACTSCGSKKGNAPFDSGATWNGDTTHTTSCIYVRNGVNFASRNLSSRAGTFPTTTINEREITDEEMDDYVRTSNPEPWSKALQETFERGRTIEADHEPQLSGPSTATSPGKTTTTTDANGNPTSTTTQSTRHSVTYNNNTYNYNNTTITNNQTDNPEEETTTEEENAENPDPCKANPDRVGCAELDEPEEEIPRSQHTVTYSPENLFASGSCPANKTMNLNGQQVTVWDWNRACGYIVDYIKPVLLTIATFSAFLILSPGKDI